MPSRPHPPRADLFTGLVDDAALFPPGNAPMADGLRAHAAHRQAAYGALVGPFLCPVTRIDELAGELTGETAGAASLRLGLVVDEVGEATHRALRTAMTDPRLALVAVEAPLRLLGADAATVGENMRRLPDVAGCLEVPRRGFDDGLDLVAAGGWRVAKYRTGGTTADAFPAEVELAAFLVACAARDLPFKLTAGLHHAVRGTAAVRNTDPATGVEQHGVLNVLLATAVAAGGSDEAAVAEVLAVRDATALATEVASWSATESASVRWLFRSFGCCGVSDPIGELAGLGLLEAA